MEMLKQLRQSRKLTQQDVAQFLGVDRSTYVKYERGTVTHQRPPLFALRTILMFLSISFSAMRLRSPFLVRLLPCS